MMIMIALPSVQLLCLHFQEISISILHKFNSLVISLLIMKKIFNEIIIAPVNLVSD